jgi:hypothetical protein
MYGNTGNLVRGTRSAIHLSMTKLPLLMVAAVAAVACKAREAPPAAGLAGSAAGESASASEGGSAGGKPGDTAAVKPGKQAIKPIESGPQAMTGTRPRQGANCPASVPGASTKIELTPDGVDVSVTAKDPAVERQILELAAFHARGETAEVSKPHDGKHGGSGGVGYCPIIVNETTRITTSDIPGGVTLHIHARSPSRVKELQEMVKQRAMRLPGYLSA